MPRITHYSVQLTPNTGSPEIALIDCACDGGHALRINFIAVGTNLPANWTAPLYPDFPWLHYYGSYIYATADQFVAFLDLLRNEKDVYAIMSLVMPEWNCLTAGSTQVGWGHFT